MRRKLFFALILNNCLLGIALFTKPADSQIIPRGIRDCCQYEEGEGDYCCAGCCWLVRDCSPSEPCS